jgi:hypothetical protein
MKQILRYLPDAFKNNSSGNPAKSSFCLKTKQG